MTTRACLADTGQVYVTRAAAMAYARFADLRLEEARRELTEVLLDATRSGDRDEYPELWRYRRSSDRIDVSARVAREGRLAVVVAVNARHYRAKSGAERRKR